MITTQTDSDVRKTPTLCQHYHLEGYSNTNLKGATVRPQAIILPYSKITKTIKMSFHFHFDINKKKPLQRFLTRTVKETFSSVV